MRRIRTCLFWTHLLAGFAGGLVILVMSATGLLLAFKPQIQAFVERDVRMVRPNDMPRRPLADVLAAAASARPEAMTQSVTVSREPGVATVVAFRGGERLFVDPYSARVVGAGSMAADRVFQEITGWHRYLGAGA